MTDEKIIELYFERNETAIEETGRKYGAYCFRLFLAKIVRNLSFNKYKAKHTDKRGYAEKEHKQDNKNGWFGCLSHDGSWNRSVFYK